MGPPSRLVMLVVVVACTAVLFTGVDPILVTEYSVVFSAIALPLTYLPILIVADDRGYMGAQVNGRVDHPLPEPPPNPAPCWTHACSCWTVTALRTTVELDGTAASADTLWVEKWLRDSVVGRIPEGAMRLSDIIGLEVRDARTHRVGRVTDVRHVLGGDPHERPADLNLAGPAISPRTRSSYLGYERTDARSPLLLAAVARWLHRGTFLVALRDGYPRFRPLLRADD